MKKNISLIAFLVSVLFSGVAFGQDVSTENENGGTSSNSATTTPPNQGKTTLNVKLYPILSLSVGGGDGTGTDDVIDLIYDTEDAYKNGVSVTKSNHLKVNSTGGYVVKAKAETNLNYNGPAAADFIEAGTITLKIGDGEAKALTTEYAKFNSSTTSVRNKTYDVTYKGANDFAYVEKYVNGENPAIYTTEVKYIIEAS